MTPRRPPERKRAGEIAVRNVIHPLFALGNCSKGKEARKRGVRVRVI
jgi:hypothetical protein